MGRNGLGQESTQPIKTLAYINVSAAVKPCSTVKQSMNLELAGQAFLRQSQRRQLVPLSTEAFL